MVNQCDVSAYLYAYVHTEASCCGETDISFRLEQPLESVLKLFRV